MDTDIVVGVDGSAESLAAVTFAADEAELHHTGLHIVHAFIWPLMHVPLEPSPNAPADAGLRQHAENSLIQAAFLVDDRVPVTTELATGSAASVLIQAAHKAPMVVVGNRGLGGFTGLLAGSVSTQLAEHAPGPVVVVRDGPQLYTDEYPNLPVLVGVDDSDNCEPALAFAFAEAAARKAPLHAVHAWTHPHPERHGQIMYPVYDPDTEIERTTQILTKRLTHWREKYPDVTVQPEVVHHNPRRALIDASGKATLVVVGSHGRGAFTGLLLGSVSQALIHHAHCPVAVIRPQKQ
jgi:nucleotide-binding universal stress UspA family protein